MPLPWVGVMYSHVCLCACVHMCACLCAHPHIGMCVFFTEEFSSCPDFILKNFKSTEKLQE